MTLEELISVWRSHRNATTHDELLAAKHEVIEFLEAVRADAWQDGRGDK